MKVGLSNILVFSAFTLLGEFILGVYCLRHIQLKEKAVCLFFLFSTPPPLFSEEASYSVFLNCWDCPDQNKCCVQFLKDDCLRVCKGVMIS